jgi:predicted DNA-binding transcriptional regulator AlpA
MADMNRQLNTAEVCELFGISRPCMHQRRLAGKIKGGKDPETDRLTFRLGDVIEAMDIEFPPYTAECDSMRPGAAPVAPELRLLTIREAAKMMGFAVDTLLQRRKRGHEPLPVSTGQPRDPYRYRWCDVDAEMRKPTKHPGDFSASSSKHRKGQTEEPEAFAIKYIDLIASCPMCGHKRPERVVAGSSKWIYCDPCRASLRYTDKSNCDRDYILSV